MTITIIGSGAIGGVLGAYLIRGGENVVFCDVMDDHVSEINKNGMTIEGPEETFTVKAAAYTQEGLLERGEQLDIVLLCVKAHHTLDALKPLIPLLTERSYVVSFQNGLCEQQITSLIGKDRTIGCFVNFSADYLKPGYILYGGVSSVFIGELDGEMSQRVLSLQEMLERCWGPISVTNNIWGYLWSKLSYGALLYATALVDETMANVVRDMQYRDTLVELCCEVLDVAKQEGVTPEKFDLWDPSIIYPLDKRDPALMEHHFEFLTDSMANNKKTKSGVWRDLAVRKRKTEVDEHLLRVVEIGERHGSKLPLTSLLTEMIHELEDGSREMNWSNLAELKELNKLCKSP